MKFVAGMVVGGVATVVGAAAVAAKWLIEEEQARKGVFFAAMELSQAAKDPDDMVLWVRKASLHRAERLYEEAKTQIAETRRRRARGV